MCEAKGKLTAEGAAVLKRAIEAAGDALYREHVDPDERRPEPEQLRADALGLLLCRRHQRLVHEEGRRIYRDSVGQVVFFSPAAG